MTYPNAADKYEPRTDWVLDKIPSVISATSNSVSHIFSSKLPLLRSFKHLTSDDLRIILNANKSYQNFPFTFARAIIKSQKDPRIFKPITKTVILTPSKTSSLKGVYIIFVDLWIKGLNFAPSLIRPWRFLKWNSFCSSAPSSRASASSPKYGNFKNTVNFSPKICF